MSRRIPVEPDDPAALRRYAAEVHEDGELTLREDFERRFGMSVEALKSDPMLLDHFLRHDDPRIRASAIVFTASHYREIGEPPKDFDRECVRLAQPGPDSEVRQAAITALTIFHKITRSEEFLILLARIILDPDEAEACRKAAYLSFRNSVGLYFREISIFKWNSILPGSFEAFVTRGLEVLERDVSDFERNFVRAALRHLGIEDPSL